MVIDIYGYASYEEWARQGYPGAVSFSENREMWAAQRIAELVEALTCDAVFTRNWEGDHWGGERPCWCNHAFDDNGHTDICLRKRTALAQLHPEAGEQVSP